MSLHNLAKSFAAEHGLDPDVVESLLTHALAQAEDIGLDETIQAGDTITATLYEADDLEDEDVTEEVPAITSPGHKPRYADLGLIGEGGMGEVRRVVDRELRRTVAMKVLRAPLARKSGAVDRFLAEARATSQLEHPGIVPVYELGRLDDGRPYFTMKEVRGRTLQSMRRAKEPLRRLVEVFRTVCEAITYAHARGVIHRDIKPSNVLVGAYGEVIVVDWGLASVLGNLDPAADPDATEALDIAGKGPNSITGRIMGTPSYMSPEQAGGDVEVGAKSDVFQLGATLYELLTGKLPFTGGSAIQVMARILAGDMPVPEGPDLDDELIDICTSAMQRDPKLRPTASELTQRVVDWIEGTRVRERAHALVAEADELASRADDLRARADIAETAAIEMLEGARSYDPETRKHSGWLRQDEAKELRRRAIHLDVQRLNTLRSALTHVPELDSAHDRLAAYFRGHHRKAEARGDDETADRAAALLASHDRGAHADYLKGDGAITLLTDPPGATVELHRFVERHRRLVPERTGKLGTTPLREVSVPMGSYLLHIRGPGTHEVRYPVHITRQHHWSGVGPGDAEPTAIHLPRAGELEVDDCYVPAGWFEAGGDPEAVGGLPAMRVWVDAFVIKQNPVTVAEYLDFLNDLVEQGRGDEAERYCPRQRGGAHGAQGLLLWGRAANGSFMLVPDAEGDLWDAAWPVIMVDWLGAMAYAEWMTQNSGRAWRLPVELEWAKAARGVDRRRFVWGNFLEPSWCANRDAFSDRPMPVPVDQFPIDTSVYGVRGLAGNTRDWLLDPHGDGLPVIEGDRVVLPTEVDLESLELRRRRGGAWLAAARTARLAKRDLLDPRDRNFAHGFRLARSL